MMRAQTAPRYQNWMVLRRTCTTEMIGLKSHVPWGNNERFCLALPPYSHLHPSSSYLSKQEQTRFTALLRFYVIKIEANEERAQRNKKFSWGFHPYLTHFASQNPRPFPTWKNPRRSVISTSAACLFDRCLLLADEVSG
jgi:hypothetical protein